MGIRRVPPSGAERGHLCQASGVGLACAHTGHSSAHCCHDHLSAAREGIYGARRPSALSGGLSLTPGVPLHPPFFSSFCPDCWWQRQAHANATTLPSPVDGCGEQRRPHRWPLQPLGEGQTHGSTVRGCALWSSGQEPSMSNTPHPMCPCHLGADSCLSSGSCATGGRPGHPWMPLGRGSMRAQQAARDAEALASVFTAGDTGAGGGLPVPDTLSGLVKPGES